MLFRSIVTPDEIQAVFKGTDQEKVMYRLPTNIYNIRKDGGIVKVHKDTKDSRKVVGYQLVNHTEFNAQGRYVGKQTVSSKETTVSPEKTAEAVTA